jgi:hypothetical protein
MALAKLKPHFERENPVTQLMVDIETGNMKEEIRGLGDGETLSECPSN